MEKLPTEWADGETRAFLARPAYSAPFDNVLRLVCLAAMGIAALNVVWILIF